MPRMSRGPRKRRVRYCVYCRHKFEPDYKDAENLGNTITDRGKIFPRRLSGLCAKHQRRVSAEIKRARHMAILPFVAENMR